MRILWHSVAPWIKTGYGSQTEIFTKRLNSILGHDVAISSWASRGRGLFSENGIPIYPGVDGEPFGDFIVAKHAKHWNADLVITLTDSWVFDPEAMKQIPWVPWTPIDHSPTPPKVEAVLKKGYAVPVVYSKFGEAELKKSGLSPLYVPHGCHETYFLKTTKQEARKRLDFPQDSFIVGMVGVNQGAPNRKSYPQAIEAFQRFNKKHKDSFLYMHTRNESKQGLNLNHLIQHLGVDQNCIRFPNSYDSLLGYDESYLRDVYSAIDVFLAPFMGEGFGIPIIEAQACGAPIIGTNFSTVPELTFYGELIEGIPIYTNQSSFQRLPSVSSIFKALNTVYNYTTKQRKDGSALARRSIKKHYHPDKITKEFWAPALESAKNRIGDWEYKIELN